MGPRDVAKAPHPHTPPSLFHRPCSAPPCSCSQQLLAGSSGASSWRWGVAERWSPFLMGVGGWLGLNGSGNQEGEGGEGRQGGVGPRKELGSNGSPLTLAHVLHSPQPVSLSFRCLHPQLLTCGRNLISASSPHTHTPSPDFSSPLVCPSFPLQVPGPVLHPSRDSHSGISPIWVLPSQAQILPVLHPGLVPVLPSQTPSHHPQPSPSPV